MFPTAIIIASTVLGSASAAHHAPPVVNQLETARLTQPAQRLEFGINPGEDQGSPFKFRFSDPVRLLSASVFVLLVFFTCAGMICMLSS